MSKPITITISCGTDNPNRATRGLHLATVAKSEGQNVSIFLLDEGVYLAKKGLIEHLRAATGDVADDLMAELEAKDVPILVCTPCAKTRQIAEGDLVPNARYAKATELIKLAAEGSVISL